MRLIHYIFCLIFLNTTIVQAQSFESKRVLDTNLLGTWETQVGTNEYISITIDSLVVGHGTGSFKKYTKDAVGNIDQVIYDSSLYSIPNGPFPTAIAIAMSEPQDMIEGRTSYGEIRDYGVTRGDVDNRRLWDSRFSELRIYKDCFSCGYKMHFKITSLKLFVDDLGTLFPTDLVLDKIN
ncbi:hypothetical protein BST92_05530 [Nonlabens arenilitoris]|uniref:Lipocalin-like domain-containing protein n=1 Tax=Nonlabens arenilitoris TaxID=1217969 RepID=A0A2S7UAH9_9FLAO|nr:hypothetical protein [Nonlabens arenilitoris]PQJ31414.1 hypothetical protein BST92_05530 [Nonlabens arenilitoris]